jgi:hypothetical protein
MAQVRLQGRKWRVSSLVVVVPLTFMAQFRLLSGPFAGKIVTEKAILPQQFTELTPTFQSEVLAFGKDRYGTAPVSLKQLIIEYEMSWGSEEMNPTFRRLTNNF